MFESITKFIGVLVMTVLIILYFIFASGFMLWCYWDWFIQPVIPLRNITYFEACGLGFVLWMFKSKSSKDETIDYIGVFVVPWVTLIIGWLFHLIFL